MDDFVELRHFLELFLRRWPIIVIGAVLGAVLAFVVSQQLSPVYRATATLLVGQPIQATNLDSRDLQTSEKLALTYSEIGRRQPVLQGTIEALDLDTTWQQLRSQVRFNPVEGTQLLDIIVETGSREEARKIADEIARQLILLSRTPTQSQQFERTNDFVQERLDSLRERIENGQSRISTLEQDIRTAASVEEMRSVQDEIETLEGLITEWESSYAQLLNTTEGGQATNYLEAVDEAHTNPSPVWPKVKLNTVVGGMLGMVAAMGLVLVRHYWDETLQTREDLDRILGLAPLGTITQIRGEGYRNKLISTLGSFSPITEAYRVLRSNVRFISEEKSCKVILVTSATSGEGKSLTAANLGIAMAQADLKTIVVDADLRRPVQHKIFEVTASEGMTELLRSQDLEFEDYLIDTEVELLRLLPSGGLPGNPSELLTSTYSGLLLEGLAEVADVVIVDGPPVLSVADAAILSNHADGVLLIIESGQIGRRLARQAVSALQQAGAILLGAVLNRASPKKGGYTYYYAAKRADLEPEPANDRWWQPAFLKKRSADRLHEATSNGGEGVEAKTGQR